MVAPVSSATPRGRAKLERTGTVMRTPTTARTMSRRPTSGTTVSRTVSHRRNSSRHHANHPGMIRRSTDGTLLLRVERIEAWNEQAQLRDRDGKKDGVRVLYRFGRPRGAPG